MALEDPKTLNGGRNPMAIQIILNPGNMLIADMLSCGRPKSPFKQTMGAHTTSWVVHLDRVRAMIRGKSIEEATSAMQALIVEVLGLAESRESDRLGDNARDIYRPALDQMCDYREVEPTTMNVATLQEMISSILSFYNLIPGVSMDKLVTTGRGEGTHRKTLLKYERSGQGEKNSLLVAMNGLYDGGHNGLMYKMHYEYIKQAYPNTYKFVFDETQYEPQALILSRTELGADTEEDEEDNKLSDEQITELKNKLNNDNKDWLVNVNNCLINAITDGAGIDAATAKQIIDIRLALSVPLGDMLAADQRSLDVIVNCLKLRNRGVVVLYEGTNEMDCSSELGAERIFIYHDGVNHFTALHKPCATGGNDSHHSEEDMMEDEHSEEDMMEDEHSEEDMMEDEHSGEDMMEDEKNENKAGGKSKKRRFDTHI